MNRPLIGLLTALLLASTSGAQTPGRVSPDKSERSERIERRAQEMRDQLGRSKQVKSHVRVQVRLKNGNRLRGVVKDGRLVERVNGLRFVDANAADKGAGIRLWYTGGRRNYVFVPFADLQHYTVLQRLTHKQLAEIEAELQMREQEREGRVAKERAEKADANGGAPPIPGAGPVGETAQGGDDTKAPVIGGKPQAGGGAETETETKTAKSGEQPAKGGDDAQQETHKKWFKLVQDYPPANGWNAAKRDEISRRFQVIGARPSAFEQRFVDEFGEWKKAIAHFGVETEQQETGEEPVDRRKSRRRSRRK